MKAKPSLPACTRQGLFTLLLAFLACGANAAPLPLPVAACRDDPGFWLPATPGPLGITRFAADMATAPDAASGATTAATDKTTQSAGFLFFPDKVSFHRFSGWMAGGSLLAAGIVGGIHFLGMMDEAHAYRDSLNIDEFNAVLCPPKVESVWGGQTQQTLRWTHVGLLGIGELFYVANAVTGTGFMGPLEPGWSKTRIHRYAFFAHATLMATEIGLGLFMSDALKRGDHETMRALGAAHVVIGLAVPSIILGAGALMGP